MRLAAAAASIARARLPRASCTMLGQQFHVEVLGFGERVAPVEPAALTAAARRSDVEGALAGVRDKYQGRPIAGIVLVSDGGDTSGGGERAAAASAPIFGIGVGAPASGRDREILGVTAAEAILDDSRVELAVSAVSHGFGKTPFDLRLLENGKLIDARRVTPAGDGTPVREIFQVSPGAGAPTVYKVETPVEPGELVPENNVRSTLVQPPTRPRRVLLIEGAPGFEHGFLKRAWASDRGLEVDSVVRKGKNEQGADTFYIQATQSRGEQLTKGYPANREALFRYDAVVFANVEGHQLSKAELDLTRSFVGERGGGLLVLGARSFARQGLGGTPIEDVLPLDFTDRGGDVLPASAVRGVNRVALTAAGEAHPIMQLSAAADETRKRWEAVPPLAAIAPVGGPRPGASVLAITSGPSGSPRALVAVQRFGEGRSMAFTGEASWRWRMLMPSSDRSFDTFWKQALRWLALSASDPMQLTVTPGAAPGADIPLRIVVRNAGFQPIPDAAVDVRVTAPDGRVESIRAVPDPARPGNDGHFLATIRPESAGVFKLAARAQQGGTTAGTANTSVLVGGVDVEMTDPHLNRGLFRSACGGVGRESAGRGGSDRVGQPARGGRARCRSGGAPRSLAHRLVVCGDTDATRRRVDAPARVGAQMTSGSETNLHRAEHGLMLRSISALVVLLAVGLVAPSTARAAGERYALIVAGASGGDEYARQYAAWTRDLTTVLVDRMKIERARLKVLSDTPDAANAATAANVRQYLNTVRRAMTRDDLLLIVLIGHGTYDGVDAKFNLVGADLESAQWAELVGGLPGRRRGGQHVVREFSVHRAPDRRAAGDRHRHRFGGAAVRHGLSRLLRESAPERGRRISTRTTGSRFGKRLPRPRPTCGATISGAASSLPSARFSTTTVMASAATPAAPAMMARWRATSTSTSNFLDRCRPTKSS